MEIIDKRYTMEHTRGDKGGIRLVTKPGLRSFKIDDVIKFSIVTKGNYNDVVFQKEFKVEEDCTEYILGFTNEEMRIGEPISDKEVTYYYEIELNNDTTLIGSRNKHKKFILYPEAATKEADE